MTVDTSPEYQRSNHVVEIHGTINEAQFRSIAHIREVPSGRFKEWADHYVFDIPDAGMSERLCGYLREQNLRHTLTVEWAWRP